MKISKAEKNDISWAVGVICAVLESFLEGNIVNGKGNEQLKEALMLLDKHNVDRQELGMYLKNMGIENIDFKLKVFADKLFYSVNNLQNKEGVNNG